MRHRRSSTESAVPALRLEWRETARSDLLSIVDYISDDSPDAAQRLKDEIEVKVSKLPDRPLIYRSGRVAGTRETVVRPNYVVAYSVTADTVVMLRVLHAHGNGRPEVRPTTAEVRCGRCIAAARNPC